MDAVTRTFPNGGGGANFINGKTLNIVARSRYGKRAIGNVTREIRPARNLVASSSENFCSCSQPCAQLCISVDPEVKQRIHDQIVDTSAWISTIEDERAVIDEKLKAVLSEDSDLVNVLVSLSPFCPFVALNWVIERHQSSARRSAKSEGKTIAVANKTK